MTSTNYNDKAQRIVKLGILYTDGNENYSMEPPPAHVYCWMSAKVACNDWRVVGALLEMAGMPRLIAILSRIYMETGLIRFDREAIVDACLDALEKE